MTRAPKSGDPQARPLLRLVLDGEGKELVLELTDRMLCLRPKGTRRGGPQEVSMTHGQAYLRGMMARVEAERATKRLGRRRR